MGKINGKLINIVEDISKLIGKFVSWVEDANFLG